MQVPCSQAQGCIAHRPGCSHKLWALADMTSAPLLNLSHATPHPSQVHDQLQV